MVEYQTPTTCAGVRVNPGDFIFGDADGVIVIPQELTVEVLLDAEQRNKQEDSVRRLILDGASLGDLYQEVDVF